jgi:glycosyltransferase involved in cell wall biosynthesis
MLFAEVARRVLAKEPSAIFCVAGDGPMRDELARAVAPMGESFRLLGRRNDAIALLATADVALLTSRAEGTPNVLVEAQAMGTPVVATKVGGIPDAVRDGSTGILAESGDADGLARGVLAIVHDDALRARMSVDARAFTHAEFSLERMSRSMCALYA